MTLDEAIANTLAYTKKYHCSPTKEELAFRLISESNFGIDKTLNYLTEKKYQQNKKLAKNKIYQSTKIKHAKRLIKKLEKFNNLLFVGITGSVAAGYPKKNDDIDLVIITKSDTLWISRLQIKWFLLRKQIAHRRSGQKEKANQFCLNLWLDETSLTIPDIKQNLRSGVDLLLIVPILNRRKTFEKFLKMNQWAESYVPQGYGFLTNRLEANIEINDISRTNIIKTILNNLLFRLQYFYMRRKISHEMVDNHRAFFHPSG